MLKGIEIIMIAIIVFNATPFGVGLNLKWHDADKPMYGFIAVMALAIPVVIIAKILNQA